MADDEIRGISFEPLEPDERWAPPVVPGRRKHQWTPIIPVPNGVPLPDGNNLPDADGKWPGGIAFPPHSLGKPTEVHWFHDREGSVVCGECRFELALETPTGAGPDAQPKKEYRPLTFCRRDDGKVSEWRWQAPTKPYPLFNLPRLVGDRDKAVLVFEGPRKAVRAAELFWDHIPVALIFGAKSPEHSDFTPLGGRKVRIFPDHDRPGADFADKVAALTTAAGAFSVSIIEIPANWPEKWDVADSIPDGGGPEVLTRLLASARPWTPPARVTPGLPRIAAEDWRQFGPYSMTDQGLFWIDPEGEKPKLFLAGSFEVLAQTRDTHSSDWGLLLRWSDPDGRAHEWAMPREVLGGRVTNSGAAFCVTGSPSLPRRQIGTSWPTIWVRSGSRRAPAA